MPRIAVAMLSHEGNSFTPVPTDLAAFRSGAWVVGEAEARAAFTDAGHEIAAVFDFLAACPAWSAAFLRIAQAGPAGPLPRATFEAIATEIVAGVQGERFDAVYLALHGALLVDDEPRGDLELVRRVRAAIGPSVPLGASFDLHANMDPELAALLDMGAGYKTHPHVDQRPTGARVLAGLRRCVEEGLRPRGAIVGMGAILPSINMRTAEGPMAELEAFAAGMQAADASILDATPFGGFSYGDSLAAGATAMVWRDGDPAPAAAALAAEMRARRDRFTIALPSPAEGIRAALKAGRFPVAVTDPGDNPGSGGIGDTPGLFRALLDADVQVPALFVFFADPALVERARAAGIGGALDGALGGRLTDAYGPPVPFRGTVRALSDGRFRNTGPMWQGVEANFGPTALLSLEATKGGANVRVIVTSHSISPHDPGLLALHGIAVADVALICAKAKNHFRAAWLPLLTGIIDTDAPGPAALDIASFPFRYAPKKLHPLSKD
jgi:microcystin degradation protein MlrC